MSVYLFSIFPLQEENEYARVTVVAVTGAAVGEAFREGLLVGKRELTRLLACTELMPDTFRILRDLDRGEAVQVMVGKATLDTVRLRCDLKDGPLSTFTPRSALFLVGPS